MATGILGNLKIGVSVGIGDASKAFRSLRGDLSKFVASANSGFTGFAAKAAGIAGAVLGIKSAFDTVTKGLTLAADLEISNVAFETLLGSGEAATKMLADLQKFAAQTPFEFPELQSAAKSLIAFGVPAEDVINTMRQLGDVAALSGKDFNELATLYGKAKVNQRLFADDVTRLAEAGIPIYDALTQKFGVTGSALRALVESGKADFSVLQDALRQATSEGGRFAGGMAAASQTTSGPFSTLKDTVNAQLAAIGQTLIQTFDLKGVLQGLIEFTSAAGTVFANTLQGLRSSVGAVGSESQSTGDTIFRAFEMGALAVAKLVDIADVVRLAFLKVQEIVTRVINAMIDVVIQKVGSALSILGELPDALGGETFRNAAEFLQAYSEDLGRLADQQQAAFGQALLAPSATEKVRASFDAIAAQMKANAAEVAATVSTATSDSAKVAVENVSAGAFAGISAVTMGLLNAQAVIENIPKEKTITVRQETIAAAQRGSAEAESIISKALRGPDRQIKILEETKAIEMNQAKNLDKIAIALGRATGAKLVGI